MTNVYFEVPKGDGVNNECLKLVAKTFQELIDLLIGSDMKGKASADYITLWDNDPISNFLKAQKQEELRYRYLIEFCDRHDLPWWVEDDNTVIRCYTWMALLKTDALKDPDTWSKYKKVLIVLAPKRD